MHSSHTHCQAAQSKAQTQAWQRVCLPNRTPKTTDKQTDEKEHRTDNTGFAKWRVKCFYDSDLKGSSLVIPMTFVLKIRHFSKPETDAPIYTILFGYHKKP